jgi:tRNA (cmo5U34)-methyltransferase
LPIPTTPNFDSIAPYYDSLSRLVFGNALRRAQVEHLGAIPEQAHVLLIGGGSGWLLKQLRLQKPQIQVTYLESSSKMLELAQKHCKQLAIPTAAVSFRLGDEDSLQPNESFDVILTPFLLDLFPDDRLQHLMDRLYTALHPGGLWLFSDFWPVHKPAPHWQRLMLRSMYTFFGLVSGVRATRLPDFGLHFQRLHLQEKTNTSFYSGLIQAKVYRKV